MDKKTVTAAAQPLSDAGWKQTAEGRLIRWTSTDVHAGVHFDAFTAQHPNENLATGSTWAGSSPAQGRPIWLITASPHTPGALLARLAKSLAQESGSRGVQQGRRQEARLTAGALSAPPVAGSSPARRSR